LTNGTHGPRGGKGRYGLRNVPDIRYKSRADTEKKIVTQKEEAILGTETHVINVNNPTVNRNRQVMGTSPECTKGEKKNRFRSIRQTRGRTGKHRHVKKSATGRFLEVEPSNTRNVQKKSRITPHGEGGGNKKRGKNIRGWATPDGQSTTWDPPQAAAKSRA